VKANSNGELVFSSGRELYANNGIIGIDEAGDTFGGYDGSLEYLDDPLTKEERKELSEYMIERWKKYASE
jgi:hypothetical protein